MKKHILFYLSLISILVLGACADEDSVIETNKHISFAIKKIAYTRTAYGTGAGDDQWQIKWVSEDKIRIHCAESSSEIVADYTITPESGNITGKAEPLDNEKILEWATTDKKHEFYAVYPGNTDAITFDDGKFRFPINLDQTSTAVWDEGTQTWTAPADMSKAYMVAYSSKDAGDKSAVDLNFKPIMTTFEVTVCGYVNKDNEMYDRTIDEIEFTVNVPHNGNSNPTFDYDAKNDEASGSETTSETFAWTPTNTVKLTHSTTDTPQKLVFTVFIPSTAISSSNKLDIKISSKEGPVYDVTIEPGIAFAAGSKKKIVLAPLARPTHYVPTVDFGDSYGIEWATTNIGATTETEIGNYYAWGLTLPYYRDSWPKDEYPTTKDGSKYYIDNQYWRAGFIPDGVDENQKGYCKTNYTAHGPKSSYGTDVQLNDQDDTATTNWGSGWRMPTYQEFYTNLCSKTSLFTVSQATNNGVTGYWITLKADTSKKIFLPIGGQIAQNRLDQATTKAFYWTRSSSDAKTDDARYLYFEGTGIYNYTLAKNGRFYGMLIRPVLVKQWQCNTCKNETTGAKPNSCTNGCASPTFTKKRFYGCNSCNVVVYDFAAPDHCETTDCHGTYSLKP